MINFRCGQCGSPNIQFEAWVNPNTEEIEYQESRDFWCQDEDTEHRGVVWESNTDMDDLYAHIEDD